MPAPVADPSTFRWEPPGAGHWEWQGSHLPGMPTPIYGAAHLYALPAAMARMFLRYGVPLRTLDERLVNGRLYASLAPLGRAGGASPPRPILWLAGRLHPELRRRNKVAARALADRIWRTRTLEWTTTLRPGLRATNRALQSEDLTAMDDAALADHVGRAHANVVDGHLLHFDLHGDDMGPLGLYLAACREWSIPPREALAALAGHSPSTTAAVDALRTVEAAVAASGADLTHAPTTLDGLRALGSGVAAALDDYLDEYGWRVVTGYDLDAKTVGELPEVLVANVLALPADRARETAAQGDAAADALRGRVPAGELARFEERLAEARVALDLRDDNGPMTVEWPVGLLRRALLEVGRRGVARGALVEPDHALELTYDEVLALLAGEDGVGAARVRERAAARAAASAVVPPSSLGPAVQPPDISALPRPLATVTDMAMTCVALLEREDPTATATARSTSSSPRPGAVCSGIGVGSTVCTGRARVAHTPGEALARLEPGEVLVVPFTTPAYNAVLAVAGGLVTEQGGPLSHAAVLARELHLPSVIGVADALATIGDGDEVEVDPAAGTVRVLSSSRT